MLFFHSNMYLRDLFKVTMDILYVFVDIDYFSLILFFSDMTADQLTFLILH